MRRRFRRVGGDNKVYRRIMLNSYYPLYWDDGVMRYGVGGLFAFEKRRYRTWKHTRRKQYKNNCPKT